MKMVVLLLLLSAFPLCVDALNNGLALTPPMGWLSWERFRCETDCVKFPDSCINEQLYKAMADRMVSDGYKEAGYEYVHIDDCWAAPQRDEEGRLQADPDRFPSGMKALADYVHGQGLKLGIYTAIGHATCQNFPASQFYMESDANTFAEWGVDMVKTDICHADYSSIDVSYPSFGFFLNKTGRPMVYGCSWPLAYYYQNLSFNYSAVRQHCNVWRNCIDIQDSWEKVKGIVNYYGKNVNNFAMASGPGGFADPDQLIVGNFGLSYYQQKAQFGMWAMFAAPLFMSVDLRTIHPESRAILLNREVIAINQDPRGAQAIMLYTLPNSISVWLKPLSTKGSYSIAFLNEDDHGRPATFTLQLADIGLANSKGYNVTDVFDHVPRGVYLPTSDLSVLIDPTSIVLLKVLPV